MDYITSVEGILMHVLNATAKGVKPITVPGLDAVHSMAFCSAEIVSSNHPVFNLARYFAEESKFNR
jgi:hypothetical protein